MFTGDLHGNLQIVVTQPGGHHEIVYTSESIAPSRSWENIQVDISSQYQLFHLAFEIQVTGEVDGYLLALSKVEFREEMCFGNGL